MNARLDKPTRLLAGRWRHRIFVARVVAGWWPPLLLLPVWLAGRLVQVVVIVAAIGGEVWWRVVSNRFRAAWWRSRWWFDCRACGLVIVAEATTNAAAEAGRWREGFELAPPLRRVRFAQHRRVYLFKLLPGQLPDDVERARLHLETRWSAPVEVELHPRGRRRVVLTVWTRDPLADPVVMPGRLLGGGR